MTEHELRTILEHLRREGGDDASFEAKSCASGLSKDVWESVSAFANSVGGTLLLGISESDGFVPVSDFQTHKVCDQFVSGMGDGGSPGFLSNPPEYTIERVPLGEEVVLAIRIHELSAAQKPCYITARGVQPAATSASTTKTFACPRMSCIPCSLLRALTIPIVP